MKDNLDIFISIIPFVLLFFFLIILLLKFILRIDYKTCKDKWWFKFILFLITIPLGLAVAFVVLSISKNNKNK